MSAQPLQTETKNTGMRTVILCQKRRRDLLGHPGKWRLEHHRGYGMYAMRHQTDLQKRYNCLEAWYKKDFLRENRREGRIVKASTQTPRRSFKRCGWSIVLLCLSLKDSLWSPLPKQEHQQWVVLISSVVQCKNRYWCESMQWKAYFNLKQILLG